MNNRKPKPLVALEAQAENWNAKHEVGAVMSYETIIGEGETHRGATRSEAQVMGGHSVVVWLEGKRGYVLVEHCTPVAPEAEEVAA